MTLKNCNNHYNVKLLRGYGVSISVKDSKIILKDGQHDITGESQKEEWFVNRLPYEKIVISGKGFISTEALSLLNQHNRNVILTDTFGKPISFMSGMMDSLTATKYRMAQYDAFRDRVKCQILARKIVRQKIESQIDFLKSTNNELVKDGISKLENYLELIKNETTEPLKIEPPSSHVYFRSFAKLIPVKYGFTSRNNSTMRNSKRNATDVINALLNYGYAVLAGEVSKFVNGFGLDAYYGFMHKTHTGYQPLVYDLMEPFRWLVEYSVWKLAIAHTRTISKKDYAHTKDGSIVLDSELIRRFLEILERKFQFKTLNEFKHGKKTKNELKNIQSITQVKVFVNQFLEDLQYKSETPHP